MENASAQIDPHQFRRASWSLAIAQLLIWAAMFYSFPALLLTWEQDLGWSKAELSGALTVALVVGAPFAPLVGRLIDRGYGSKLLTGCSFLGAIFLATLSMVTAVWQFYLVWILMGITMTGALYEACFAVLTKTLGPHSKRAITIVTLVAGFAGTVSFPGSYALQSWFGWRMAVVILAAVVAFIVTPLMWIGTRSAEQLSISLPKPAPKTQEPRTFQFTRNITFWLLGLGFATIALNHGVLLTHMLPILTDRGVSEESAVFAASMIGPMQVLGRIIMLTVERRVSPIGIVIGCFAAMGVASLLLLGSSTFTYLVIGFVLFQGSGYGVTSIMRPVLTATLLGYENYGVMAGFLAIAFQGSAALAPTIAALIWGVGGYDLVIWFAISMVVFGLIILTTAGSTARRPASIVT